MPLKQGSRAPPIQCTRMRTTSVWAHSRVISASRLPDLLAPRTKAFVRLSGGFPSAWRSVVLPILHAEQLQTLIAVQDCAAQGVWQLQQCQARPHLSSMSQRTYVTSKEDEFTYPLS